MLRADIFETVHIIYQSVRAEFASRFTNRLSCYVFICEPSVFGPIWGQVKDILRAQIRFFKKFAAGEIKFLVPLPLFAPEVLTTLNPIVATTDKFINNWEIICLSTVSPRENLFLSINILFKLLRTIVVGNVRSAFRRLYFCVNSGPFPF